MVIGPRDYNVAFGANNAFIPHKVISAAKAKPWKKKT
jgi:hypothetical protein